MASRDTHRPNIILIMTDDQGSWALGSSGNTEITTPSLDRLASQGIRFENFFCTSPVCSPARASMLTGQIPSQHGIHDWIRCGNSDIEKDCPVPRIEYLKGSTGYTDVLAKNGYICGFSGKWHMGDAHTPQKGFAFWETHAKGGGPYYNAPMIHKGGVYREPRYVTDAITDRAIEFLNEQEDDNEPFYLSVHYTAPHSPWDRDNHPKDVYDRYYHDCAFSSVPYGLVPAGWVEGVSIPVEDMETRRKHLSGYYAAIEEMDRNVSRILDWLQDTRLTEHTLVVFTGDNGMNMGHHGVYGKGNATYPLNMYEESVKVPFIVSCPGRVPEGIVCSELLSQYDFRPTILEYLNCGDADTEPLPGKSFAPLLTGDRIRGNDRVVVFDEYGPVRMIRTREWKYIHRYLNGPCELYNLSLDPGEENNLIQNEAHVKQAERMKKELEEWFAEFAVPDLDVTHTDVDGGGQIHSLRECGNDAAFFKNQNWSLPLRSRQ